MAEYKRGLIAEGRTLITAAIRIEKSVFGDLSDIANKLRDMGA